MFCPKCGNQIEGTPKFCPKCGEPLSADAPVRQAGAQDPAQGGSPMPAAGPSPSGGNSTISLVEKILAVCFGLFFAIRAFATLGTLFHPSYYRYYYRTGFGTLIAVLCLLLIIAGALLLGLSIVGYGLLGKEEQKKDLLVIVMAAAAVRLVLALFSYVLPPYLINRWLDFVMALAAVVLFFSLRYVQDSDIFSKFKGKSAIKQLTDGVKTFSEALQSRGSKTTPAAPAATTVPAAPAAAAGSVIPAEVARTDQTGTAGGSAGAQQTAYTQAPPVGTAFLPTDRSIAFYIILSVITCGIYGYYFLYTMARDTNVACAGDGENTPGLAQLILLSIVTCGIYAYYWDYKIGNRLFANGPRYGLNLTENGTTVLMWDIIGLFIMGIGHYIAMYVLINNLNQICAEYNKRVSA